MLVIAHRGASGHAPEHTFASWDRARDQGADYLEQDLQLSRDGVLVVMHDETLDRTVTDETGLVSERSAAELVQMDAGSWFNALHPERAQAEFADQRVPLLEQVLQRYPDACFYIETKQPESAPGMEAELLRLLGKYGLLKPAAAEWCVLVQSFSEAGLRWIHEREPSLPLIRLLDHGWHREHGTRGAFDGIAEYAVGVGPAAADVDAAWVSAAHAAGLHVHPWTVNSAVEMQRLTDAGVDGMFTDHPDVLLSLRPASEPRGRAAAAAAAAAHRVLRASA